MTRGVVFLSNTQRGARCPPSKHLPQLADAMGTQTLSWSLSGLDPQCANVPRIKFKPAFFSVQCPSNGPSNELNTFTFSLFYIIMSLPWH